jgi:ABC-2 type transport system permease protein
MSSSTNSSTNSAQILDRGYRKYEGHRSGVAGAIRSVVKHTVRSILGLGRKGRHKVFPVIVIVIAFVPSLAFLAISVLLDDFGDELQPEYWEFFGFSFLAGLVFTALVAPEAIVRDRRDGMYALYLSTPLTRVSYLTAKVIAVLGTLSIIIVGPALFAFVGYTFQGLGPDGVGNWLWVGARVLIGGLAISAIYTAVSLGASSLTDRRAFASVAVILLMLGLSIAANVMVGAAEMSQSFRLFDPLGTPNELPARLFGDRSAEYERVGTPAVVGACAAWLAAGVAMIVARYRRLAAV